MEQNNGQHGDGAQAVDIGTIFDGVAAGCDGCGAQNNLLKILDYPKYVPAAPETVCVRSVVVWSMGRLPGCSGAWYCLTASFVAFKKSVVHPKL